MDIQTKLQLDLEEAYNELEIIDMELQTAQWEDRKYKLRLKKAILHNIRKLDEKIGRDENQRIYVEKDNRHW